GIVEDRLVLVLSAAQEAKQSADEVDEDMTGVTQLFAVSSLQVESLKTTEPSSTTSSLASSFSSSSPSSSSCAGSSSSSSLSSSSSSSFLAMPLRLRALAVQAFGKVALSRSSFPSSTAGSGASSSLSSSPLSVSLSSSSSTVVGVEQKREGNQQRDGDEFCVVRALSGLLSEDEHPILRIGALAVLSDLIQRQSGIADRSLPRIVAALASHGRATERGTAAAEDVQEAEDETTLLAPLRKVAFTCLATLVSEEFVKFKGHAVQGMVYALGDPHPDIREAAEAVFLRVILPRYEAKLPVLFVECLISFNGFYTHPAFAGKAALRALCCRADRERKSRIYRFVLDRVSSLTKHRIQQRLVSSVLAAWIDDQPQLASVPSSSSFVSSSSSVSSSSPSSSLSPSAALSLPVRFEDADGALLSDALRLLACSALRVRVKKSDKSLVVDEESKEGRPGEGRKTTKGKPKAAEGEGSSVVELLDLMVKKLLQTEVVPVLRSLDVLMRANLSPFQEELLTAFCEVLRDYWDELEEMVGEASLAKELRHFAQMRMVDVSCPQRAAVQGVLAFEDCGKPTADSL
ncbi:HEAT repeat-containing protein, partial [Toxoplasma gondii CAST]